MERDFARKQISRMSQMYRFPKSEVEAIGELIDALLSSPSEDVAKEVVTAIMRDAASDTPCPMPGEIRRAITAHLEREQGEILPDPLCPKCKGVGRRIYEKNGYSYAGPNCSCWARRQPPDWRKLKAGEPIDKETMDQFNRMVAAKRGK